MVKQWFRALPALCLAGWIGGCDIGYPGTVRGDGKAREETRATGEFTALAVEGVWKITCRPGAPSVRLRGDSNILALVRCRVRRGALALEIPGSVSPKLPLEAVITVPALRKMEIGGVVDADLVPSPSTPLDLRVSGVGRVRVSGKGPALGVDLSGTGDVDARGLECDRVTVDLSGTGNAQVYAAKALKANLSGAGNLDYWGNPAWKNIRLDGVGAIRSH